MSKCKYCNSKEVTYNQLITDSYCADCGQWQEGENYEQVQTFSRTKQAQ